jgi:hypothetical protein
MCLVVNCVFLILAAFNAGLAPAASTGGSAYTAPPMPQVEFEQFEVVEAPEEYQRYMDLRMKATAMKFIAIFHMVRFEMLS